MRSWQVIVFIANPIPDDDGGWKKDLPKESAANHDGGELPIQKTIPAVGAS